MDTIYKILILIIVGLTAIFVGQILTAEAIDPSKPPKDWYVYQNNYRGYAYHLVSREWSVDHWHDFDKIIENESSWQPKAENPNSSAIGLPQAMSSIHDLPENYRSNPKVQIRWAIKYTKTRYQNPKQAWEHWQQHNWW